MAEEERSNQILDADDEHEGYTNFDSQSTLRLANLSVFGSRPGPGHPACNCDSQPLKHHGPR